MRILAIERKKKKVATTNPSHFISQFGGNSLDILIAHCFSALHHTKMQNTQ